MNNIHMINDKYNLLVNPFFKFLTKFNIIPLAFSFIISMNLNQLSNSFGKTIISPIISKIFSESNIKLEERTIIIFDINFQYGLFLMNLVQFFFTLLTLYLLFITYNYITDNELVVTI